MPRPLCLLLSMNLLLFQHHLHIKLLLFSSLEFQINNHHRIPFFKIIQDPFCQILGCRRDAKHHRGTFQVSHKPDNFNFLLFSQPFYRPPYNHHPHHGEYNPFQNLFMKQNNEDKTQQSSLFPLNINKMHVSLSGSSDGVSLTIETHQGQNKNQQNPPTRNSTETSQVVTNALHIFIFKISDLKFKNFMSHFSE